MKKPRKPEYKKVDPSPLIKTLEESAIISTGYHKLDEIREKYFHTLKNTKIDNLTHILGEKHARFLSETDLPLKVFPDKPRYSKVSEKDLNKNGRKVSGVVQISPGKITSGVGDEFGKASGIFTASPSELSDKPDFLDREFRKINGDHQLLFEYFVMSHGFYGVYLDVLDGITIEDPFLVQIDISSIEGFFPLHIFVDIGKKSKASLLIDMRSEEKGGGQPILLSKLHLNIESAGELDLLQMGRMDAKSCHFSHESAVLNQDAVLNSFILDSGSGLVDRTVSVDLIGRGSSADVTGVYTPSQEQAYFYDTAQNHLASDTTSDLLFKGVIGETGYAWWKGNILVEAGTTGANGYQANNNLMMDDTAKVESIPGLEIKTDDVRCSHGVTMGNVDKDQLFYLRSRGIGLEQAERLIVDGFLTDTLKRVSKEEFKNQISEKIFT